MTEDEARITEEKEYPEEKQTAEQKGGPQTKTAGQKGQAEVQQERTGVRLNKFLAERLGISRREADERIKAGEVTINGKRAEIGNRVDKNDSICCNNKPIPFEVEFVYYAFNKPVGYVCSRSKQGKDPTIYEILPESMQGLKNVGRLDRMSSGIILLTNDGDFGFQLTHPQFVKQKVYEVTLHRPLTPKDRKKITEEGVEIADGLSRFEVADNLNFADDDTPLKQKRIQKRQKQEAMHEALVAAAKAADHPEDAEAVKKAEVAQKTAEENQPDGMHLIVTLTEGRNRQIRRTFAALGYNVVTLHRVKFGDYELGDLEPGKWRKIEK